MVLAASPWEELPGKPRVQIPRVQLSNLNVTTQVQLSSPQQVFFVYLFSVSKTMYFHSNPSGAPELILQLRPWALVKISWKQPSPWTRALRVVQIWVYSALLGFLYHQPNQNLGSSSP